MDGRDEQAVGHCGTLGGLSQDTELNTLRMAYDLLQEENEETKHQLVTALSSCTPP